MCIRDRSLVQVGLDQLLVFPLVYFPLFYTLQAGMDPNLKVSDGLQRWRSSLWGDCTTAWTVWAPVQLANFAFVPVQWRAPFISTTGVLWTVYLSHTKGSVSEVAHDVDLTVVSQSVNEMDQTVAHLL
eukprot:TRINITY_DN27207_c0_g1_i2.p1 TRINITY_DN27207_c0_g1~~TRINITY_DN27207_c0_g1_i2.p1  ORF type:complete len:128 (-),score=15.23 TRINITY_DN27207_c0_g1_i2:169-552(-)